MENGKRRVVITGLGLITPLGLNVAETWKAILAGQSGFSTESDQFEREGLALGGTCEVRGFDPDAVLGRKEARRRDRVQQLAAVAVAEALSHSGLQITDDNRERVGIFMGTGVGGIKTTIEVEHTRQESGPRRVTPYAVTMIMPNGAAGMAAIDYGIWGPSTTITTACAAGSDAIGYAFHHVRGGMIDAAIAGGTESPITTMAMAGFERAGALSSRTAGTPSPFDKSRDGLVPGEGAGVIVIESLESARARGARILAEIVGYGQTTDAFHITAPAENGTGAARAIRMALRDGGIKPHEIDYINAHGTGTQLNDSSETTAIKSVLGEHAYSIGVSSTKSMTGHIMGGTGAIESVFCTLALQEQIMPPTINLVDPSPECDLDYVSSGARPARLNVVSNHAFGFGGHNAVLIFRRFADGANGGPS